MGITYHYQQSGEGGWLITTTFLLPATQRLHSPRSHCTPREATLPRQRHSLPFGALSHSRACLIGLLHKHVEKFPALPLVQVGLTAVCFRSRPQPTSTAAAHYPNHCCCLTHESLIIHHRSSTISTPFFLSRSMAIVIILMAAELHWIRWRRPRN